MNWAKAYPLFPGKRQPEAGFGGGDQAGQGSEYVFTLVKLFIASTTPSL
jgi:hypothetical protein